jgi:hypothetical protein
MKKESSDVGGWLSLALVLVVLALLIGLAHKLGEPPNGPVSVSKFLRDNPTVVAHSYDVWHDGSCDVPGQNENWSSIDAVTRTGSADFGSQSAYRVHCTNGYSSTVDGTP